jgi:hypothetical protein
LIVADPALTSGAIPAEAPEGEPSDNGAVYPPAPPGPPRPITPRVRRRGWAEPHVRAVALAAVAATLVSAYFFASRYLEWRREARLVSQGTPVSALVTEAGGITLANKVVPPTTPVTLEYEAGGRKVTVQGTLKGRKEHIVTGHTVPIRVRPDDPETWTSLPEPRPLRMELLGGLIVLPFAAVFGILAWVLHRRVLKLWRDGSATPAVILDSRHTAIGPRTHLVRCTPVRGDDRRLLHAYLPATMARPQQGDELWLITRPSPSNRAVSAAWFE